MNPFKVTEAVPTRRQVVLSFFVLWGSFLGIVILLTACNAMAFALANQMREPAGEGSPTTSQNQQGGFGLPGFPQGDGDLTFRVTSEYGNAIVRQSASSQSREMDSLAPGTLVSCESIGTGERYLGTDQWAYCPEVGGYILMAVLQPAQGGVTAPSFPAGAAPEATAAPAPTLPPPPTATATPLPTETPVPSETPSPTDTPVPTVTPLASSSDIDLADAAPLPASLFRQVSASNTDPGGQDGCRNPTSYAPELMVDGNPATAWRTQGEGVGESVRITFSGPLVVTEVQILSGYAKIDPCARNVDRWPQGYRASVVELVFSDGTTVPRELADARELQSLPLDEPVTAEWVEVRIVESRPPSASGAPRPYAAISEIAVIGVQP